jgi:hypothetical protein
MMVSSVEKNFPDPRIPGFFGQKKHLLKAGFPSNFKIT